MNNRLIKTIGLLLLMAAANLSYGQYINKLYDNDSTADWGGDIFVRPDNTYMILGTGLSPVNGKWNLLNLTISADGNYVTNRHVITNDYANLYLGNPQGTGKQLENGGYITPITLQYYNAATSYLYSCSGIVKYNSLGDTVFVKTYTDTSSSFENVYSCANIPGKGYLIGGGKGLNTPSIYKCYIIRTDTMGNIVWTHTYQKDVTQGSAITTIANLSNGHILVGAKSVHYVNTGIEVYNHDTPWFMLLDSAGNIIRDTLYASKYGGGRIYKDSLGGYIHIGQIDSLATGFVNDYQNFPNYIAHLDTNFRMEWITRFPYTEAHGHRYGVKLIQLHDGNYVITGDAVASPLPVGWATKVDRSGNILWNHYYTNDTSQEAYLTDVAEGANGQLVFTGATYNAALPAWHQNRDVWLVVTDSNGCEQPGCSILQASAGHPVGAEGRISVWPNPSTGQVAISAPAVGQLAVYDMQGRQAAAYKLQKGENSIALPQQLSAGMYFCRYRQDDGAGVEQVVRLMYQP